MNSTGVLIPGISLSSPYIIILIGWSLASSSLSPVYHSSRAPGLEQIPIPHTPMTLYKGCPSKQYESESASHQLIQTIQSGYLTV